MEIRNLNIKKGGQANFADRIDKVVYNENLGLTPEEFKQLQTSIRSLPNINEQLLAVIKEVNLSESETEKESKMEKVKTLLLNSGASIAEGISASTIFETIKYFLA